MQWLFRKPTNSTQFNTILIVEQHMLIFNKSQLQLWEGIRCTFSICAKAEINGAHVLSWVITGFLEMLPFGVGKKRKIQVHIKAQMGDICMLIITHRQISAARLRPPLVPALW